MTRWLVTGAGGLLGLNFALRHARQQTVVGVVHRQGLVGVPFETLQADLSQPGAVDLVLAAARPDVILHAAALANVDACESDPQAAQRVNAELPAELARAAARLGIQMVHISTDAVFDGKVGYYREEDAPNPLSVYARTKLAGEQAVLAAFPQALVARVNFFGWSLAGKRSLAEWFFNNLRAGRNMKGFTDVLFCPMNVIHLSDLLAEMTAQGLTGLYHVVGPEALSKYEFGLRIARRFRFSAKLIEPASVYDGGLAAARSPNLTLNTEKLRAALGQDLPDVSAGLDLFYHQFRQGYPDMLRTLGAAA